MMWPRRLVCCCAPVGETFPHLLQLVTMSLSSKVWEAERLVIRAGITPLMSACTVVPYYVRDDTCIYIKKPPVIPAPLKMHYFFIHTAGLSWIWHVLQSITHNKFSYPTQLSFNAKVMGEVYAIMNFTCVGQILGYFTHSCNRSFRARGVCVQRGQTADSVYYHSSLLIIFILEN